MAINIPKCVWEPPKTVDQIFKENYTYVKYKEYGGEMHKFFKCNKCNDMVEEFLLYAHLEDHKNPNALFGQEALEELSKMSEMHIEAMKENLSDEDYEKVEEKELVGNMVEKIHIHHTNIVKDIGVMMIMIGIHHIDQNNVR